MLKRRKRKEIKQEVKKVEEPKTLKDEELESEVKQALQGYYNLISLMKSNGIVARDLNNFKIDEVLKDKIKLSMYGLFDYENLPSEIPSHLIEEILFDGTGAFYEVGGEYYISNYVVKGDRDRYNEPITIQPILKNGKTLSERVVGKNVVLLYNSPTKFTTYQTIEPFIKRCVLNFEVGFNNLKMSATRFLFTSDDNKSLSNLKKEISMVLNGSGSVAFTHSNLGNIKDFPLYEKFDSSEYWEDFTNTYNLMYNLLGINANPNEDKKERLIVDEVNINKHKVGLVLEAMFKTRNDFVKKINEMFNLNIKLKMYINYKEGEREYEEEDITE